MSASDGTATAGADSSVFVGLGRSSDPVVADDVRITWLGHATVLIEMDGVRLLTDPFFGTGLGPLRRLGPTPDPATIGPIDTVLVSHAHPDHFDLSSLRRVGGEPMLVVPNGLGRVARRTGQNVRELAAGDRFDVEPASSWGRGGRGIGVTAVPARHWRWPLRPGARCIGYLIEGSVGIYFAGDTALFPAMDRLAGRVAIALLPVGRWGPHRGPDRLSPASAVEAMSRVGARAAIPIHWGTFHPPGMPPGRWGSPAADAGARFASAAGERSPELDIRVLQPGESTEFQPTDIDRDVSAPSRPR